MLNWIYMVVILVQTLSNAESDIYVPDERVTADEAASGCNLATPEIHFNTGGYTVELDGTNLKDGDSVWSGHVKTYAAFLYEGCREHQNVNSSHIYTDMFKDPGECYSRCKTNVIGMQMSTCYCNPRPREANKYATGCNIRCSNPRNTVCGKNGALAIYRKVKYPGSGGSLETENCRAFHWEDDVQHFYTWRPCSNSYTFLCGIDAPSSTELMFYKYGMETWMTAAALCFIKNEKPAAELSSTYPDFNFSRNDTVWIGQIRSLVVGKNTDSNDLTPEELRGVITNTGDQYVLEFKTKPQKLKSLCEYGSTSAPSSGPTYSPSSGSTSALSSGSTSAHSSGSTSAPSSGSTSAPSSGSTSAPSSGLTSAPSSGSTSASFSGSTSAPTSGLTSSPSTGSTSASSSGSMSDSFSVSTSAQSSDSKMHTTSFQSSTITSPTVDRNGSEQKSKINDDPEFPMIAVYVAVPVVLILVAVVVIVILCKKRLALIERTHKPEIHAHHNVTDTTDPSQRSRGPAVARVDEYAVVTKKDKPKTPITTDDNEYDTTVTFSSLKHTETDNTYNRLDDVTGNTNGQTGEDGGNEVDIYDHAVSNDNLLKASKGRNTIQKDTTVTFSSLKLTDDTYNRLNDVTGNADTYETNGDDTDLYDHAVSKDRPLKAAKGKNTIPDGLYDTAVAVTRQAEHQTPVKDASHDIYAQPIPRYQRK